MATPVIYIAELQDEDSLFSLGEICERCGVPADIVVEMVEGAGIVRPVTNPADNDRWQFDTDALLRMSRAQRLRRDLEWTRPDSHWRWNCWMRSTRCNARFGRCSSNCGTTASPAHLPPPRRRP